MSISIVSAVVMSCVCILSSNAADIMLRIQNKEGKYGFCNTNGNLVIDCMYDSASSFFPNGVCAVKKGKHLYFINKSGNEILKQWGGHTISDVRKEAGVCPLCFIVAWIICMIVYVIFSIHVYGLDGI